MRPQHELPAHEPVHEPYRAVVAQLEAFREFAYGNVVAPGKPLYRQQGLVLLGSKARGPGGLPAESLEPAQRMAQRGQELVVGLRDAGICRWHCSYRFIGRATPEQNKSIA
jgi:hypothetical protein